MCYPFVDFNYVYLEIFLLFPLQILLNWHYINLLEWKHKKQTGNKKGIGIMWKVKLCFCCITFHSCRIELGFEYCWQGIVIWMTALYGPTISFLPNLRSSETIASYRSLHSFINPYNSVLVEPQTLYRALELLIIIIYVLTENMNYLW